MHSLGGSYHRRIKAGPTQRWKGRERHRNGEDDAHGAYVYPVRGGVTNGSWTATCTDVSQLDCVSVLKVDGSLCVCRCVGLFDMAVHACVYCYISVNVCCLEICVFMCVCVHTPGSVFCSCSALWAFSADSLAQYVRNAHPVRQKRQRKRKERKCQWITPLFVIPYLCLCITLLHHTECHTHTIVNHLNHSNISLSDTFHDTWPSILKDRWKNCVTIKYIDNHALSL